MTALDDLLSYLFDGKQPALYTEVAGWLRDSRRFRAFATDYRGKIRTKLKNLRDEGGTADLRAELQTAVLLLREARFTLEYEKYTASKQRGPDFTVTFRTHTPFNVEVRRIRRTELDEPHQEESGDESQAARIGKLMAVLCDKVGQMPPSIINVLWLVADQAITEPDLIEAAAALRGRAEQKVEGYFTRRGYASAAAFLKQYRQLSAMVVQQAAEPVIWLNAIARHRLPPEIFNAIRRLDSR